VDDVLTGAAVTAATAAPAAEPGVYTAPAAGRPAVMGGDFVKGAVFGAAVALLGALVGGWAARRR
jgi:hypothetical protein